MEARSVLSWWPAIMACETLDAATASLGLRLAQQWPLKRLGIYEVLRESARTVALAGWSGDRDRFDDEAEPLAPAAVRRALKWCGRNEIALRAGGEFDRPVPLPLIPRTFSGPVAATGWRCDPDRCGIILVEPVATYRLKGGDRDSLQRVGELIEAAIVQDGRTHEIRVLRSAADADRESLRRRLGRDEQSDEIVGANGGLRPVMQRVQLVARSDAPILILGETGSGKEVIARSIHRQSLRARAPFVRVNCGALPPDLIDSELFGHEKGAFTGATATRMGWFERADEGTLFLDEIGELTTAAQVRLLRILQDGTFQRVGGGETRHVNVRIVAATHRDLPRMIHEGRFREDLWYRLAVFPIVLPPLREHIEDLPALAQQFVRRASYRFGFAEVGITAADLNLLSAYRWPGNVRELASVVDRAVILGGGVSLDFAAALGTFGDHRHSPTAELPASPSHLPANSPRWNLDGVMRDHITAALGLCRGRVEGPSGAALLLGINPHTLRARMRKLGIKWATFRRSRDARSF